jgi:type VII secretion protein EccB
LGPVVGIVGAPGSIHGSDDVSLSSWTVCDSTQLSSVAGSAGAPTMETTVLANNPVLSDDVQAASPQQMILTTAGDITFLIYNGVRAAINPADPILSRALHLSDSEVRPVSPGLLNSFPLVEPIVPITIEGAGEPTAYLPATYQVGSILETVDSSGQQLYVVLREGLQLVSPATADIIRYGNSQSLTASQPTAISPALLSSAPMVKSLRVDHYPTTTPRIVDADSGPVVCMSWQRAVSASDATSRLLVGRRLPLPAGAQPVALATADGDGPGLDSVYLKPGTGEYVQSTGDEPGSRAKGQLFYVSDVGLRFHIQDVPTATALGLSGTREPGSAAETLLSAPWPVLSLLPSGPELSQQAALIAHDGTAADPDGSTITPPKS